ncbi:MAG TPA: hypothetical protein VMZ24_07185 [Patescibacteria group bacterium]|nr:hypothetical protein [Patescibacteria group bacterium]
MVIFTSRLAFITVFFILISYHNSMPSKQTTGDNWEQALTLSNTDRSRDPIMVVDSEQTVHVLWIDWREIDGEWISDTIYYTHKRHGEEHWSAPVDVLLAGGEGGIEFGRIVQSPKGDLVVAWRDYDSLYVSKVNPQKASDPKAWETSKLLSGFYPWPDIAIDKNSTVYVATSENGAIKVFRLDEKLSTIISEHFVAIPGPDKQFHIPRMFVDKNNILHVVWNEISEETNWEASGVWYARSIDGGESWSNTLRDPDRGTWITVIGDESGTLHLVWSHGIWSSSGRWHRISTDGGISWGDPKKIFNPGPGNGLTGWPQLAFDSNGNLHLVTAVNEILVEGKTEITTIVSTEWDGSSWSAPESVIDRDVILGGEQVRLAISNGNQLHVTFYSYEVDDAFAIQYTSSFLDAPELPSEPIIIDDNADVINTEALPNVEQVSGRLQDSSEPLTFEGQEPENSKGYFPLVVGLGVSVIFIAFVLIINGRVRR